MALEPPPATTHHTVDEAYNAAQQWAKEHGYCLRKIRSSKDRKGDVRMYNMGCDRGGITISKARKRRVGSSKTDCPMTLNLHRQRRMVDYLTVEEWTIQVTCGDHNHQASFHPIAHPLHRRRSEQLRTEIVSMRACGVSPRNVVNTIFGQDRGMLLLRRDIYNENARARSRELKGYTSTEALLLWLQKEKVDWSYKARVDPRGNLLQLFFAYKPMIDVFRAHPDLLLADCTYKTNRYRMPLLHFIGLTSIGTHFTAAFCFMPSESQEDYAWAIRQFVEVVQGNTQIHVFLSDNESALKNASTVILPNVTQLLCVWHVSKNVLAKAQETWKAVCDGLDAELKVQQRKKFMEHWRRLCKAKTPDQYEDMYTALKHEYRNYPRLIEYLEAYQYPQRKVVAFAWTSRVKHYGNTTTSRLEQAHWVVKGYLRNSRGDLLTVTRQIKHLFDSWLLEYKGKVAKALIAPPYHVKGTLIEAFTDDLNDHVTPYALELCVNQLTMAQNNSLKSPTCSNAFETVYGIPCGHTLAEFIKYGRKVEPSDFDSHWLYRRNDVPTLFTASEIAATVPRPFITEPQVIQRTKGRPRKDDSGINRDLSQHEYAERATQRRLNRSTGTPAMSQAIAGPTQTITIPDDDPDAFGDPADVFEHIDDVMATRSEPPLVDLTSTQPNQVAETHSTQLPHARKRAQSPTTAPQTRKRRVLTDKQPAKANGRAKAAPKGTAAQRQAGTLTIFQAMISANCPPNAGQMTAIKAGWNAGTGAQCLSGTTEALLPASVPPTAVQQIAITQALAEGSNNGD